jgi:subtilase family serine protease
MPRRLTSVAFCAAALLVFLPATAGADTGASTHKSKDVCAKTTRPDTAACTAKVVTKDDGATPLATSGPTGYGPVDLRSAYNLPTTGNGTPTVAIVDAYDNPNAESDLNAYRNAYGLGTCTSASGCFTKLNQSGSTSPMPTGDTGWGQEIDLDIEMASAICPGCKILLVEANSASFGDLATAVNTAAARPGVVAISNSYGSNGEFIGETSYSSYYNHPGQAVTVSTGDSGYGVQFPAADNHVVAVGGTSLTHASNARGWSESAWSGAGSGCSSYFSKPSWQHDSGCGTRMEADVSAVADPNTGVSVYDSYGSTGLNWYVFGGTSVSSPIIASVYGLANNITAGSYPASALYSNTASLYDVTSGSNGNCVRGKKQSSKAYFCTGVAGYDGPTGLGTPHGLGAF